VRSLATDDAMKDMVELPGGTFRMGSGRFWAARRGAALPLSRPRLCPSGAEEAPQ